MNYVFVSTIAVAGMLMTGSAMAIEMPLVAKKNNCSACHAINKKIIGPAWMEVSKRYKGAATFDYNGKEYPLEIGLITKVSRGGAGHWGSLPMPPNSPAVKDADIKDMVKFILSLAP